MSPPLEREKGFQNFPYQKKTKKKTYKKKTLQICGLMIKAQVYKEGNHELESRIVFPTPLFFLSLHFLLFLYPFFFFFPPPFPFNHFFFPPTFFLPFIFPFSFILSYLLVIFLYFYITIYNYGRWFNSLP